MNSQPKIELLQAEADEDDDSFLRVLVDSQSIKYLTVEPGLYPTEDLCFGPMLHSILPQFPSGDWNDGLISRDQSTDQAHFARVQRTSFPSVKYQWHKTSVDYLDLTFGKKLRTGIYEVSHTRYFDNKVIIAKFARFEWEIGYMENETRAFEWIDGSGIGPQFLGYLTENSNGGRVIGFLMERVTNARHAGPEDFAVCQETLRRLHGLGIRHGDTNRFNFLVVGDGLRAVLIDFDTARKCDDQVDLREEFEGLSVSFEDESMRGGGGILC
ncbi:hypothetical protein BGW36DRAFT_421604 [Talaromyces proteolyticus]|uniref:Alpha-galactosidase A n=1 Tax=Talaromyces proteolyticus TaxID=1131652 RepID=A0AAD4Q659_9EURO|nr:uncharacterized protein BGW36DRAFT_421604 [Talaromyces proteolyticus]KAH8705027.1 hypothetical protein BGW36DRAFT_421604 [Talaromyces proteolyticus]